MAQEQLDTGMDRTHINFSVVVFGSLPVGTLDLNDLGLSSTVPKGQDLEFFSPWTDAPRHEQ